MKVTVELTAYKIPHRKLLLTPTIEAAMRDTEKSTSVVRHGARRREWCAGGLDGGIDAESLGCAVAIAIGDDAEAHGTQEVVGHISLILMMGVMRCGDFSGLNRKCHSTQPAFVGIPNPLAACLHRPCGIPACLPQTPSDSQCLGPQQKTPRTVSKGSPSSPCSGPHLRQIVPEAGVELVVRLQLRMHCVEFRGDRRCRRFSHNSPMGHRMLLGDGAGLLGLCSRS